MEYRPLDTAKNEIRLLKTLPPKSRSLVNQPRDMIHCILEHVSLDDYSEEYISHSINRGISWPEDLVEACARQGITTPFDEGKAGTCPPFSSVYVSLVALSSLHGWHRWKWGDYFALSYCWGDCEDSRQILVNGHEVRVTKNLHDFLETIHSHTLGPNSSCGIWIDAICINQNNIAEKNEQVKRMAAIYYQAFTTLAWLGLESNDSNMALAKLHSIGNRDGSYMADSGNILEGLTLEEEPWDAVRALLDRPYWNRLWVIQEIALSNLRLTIVCGNYAMKWSSFTNAVGALLSIYRTVDLENPGGRSVIANSLRPTDLMHIVDLSIQHMQTRLIPLRGTENIRSGLFDAVRQAQQTDPKDKIYGILSLLPPKVGSEINPNYSLPVKEVYIDFMKACISGTLSLEILRESKGCQVRRLANWPSWLPDFQDEVKRNFDFHNVVPYHASRYSEMDIRFDDSNCLHVRGVVIDAVDGLGFDFPSFLSTLSSLKVEECDIDDDFAFKDGRHLVQPTQSLGLNPYQDEEGLRTAFWHTLVAGQSAAGDLSLNNCAAVLDIPIISLGRNTMSAQCFHFEGFRAHNSHLKGEPPSHELVQEIMYRVSVLMAGRKFLITGNGYLGWAPNTSKKGDIIAVLFGCTTPMVLRPIADKRYEVVGEAYVHGFMEGKAMDDLANGCFQAEMLDLC
ncbi:heterokaryon incompatibility protein-domain-containing protein [Hyaloscypha sp. PMI_1271]|nr:heterokaryon incompatibility protein-domain-containing protein [Hyaloscypha sp. PMI_1271]